MNKYELIEELRCIDEVALVELLQLTSNDIVDAFLDKIDDNEEKLRTYINDN